MGPKPYEECPSFNNCSAPKCPLDPETNIRSRRLSEEERCRAHKPTRKKIGAKHLNLLPYGGLSKKEWTGKMTWDMKTPEEKKKITEQGANRLKSFNSGIPVSV